MTSPQVKKFTVVRKRWLRGAGFGGSSLRTMYILPSGEAKYCMCVLGFYLEACGAPPPSLLGLGMPADWVRRPANNLSPLERQHLLRRTGADWLLNATMENNSTKAQMLMSVNDDDVKWRGKIREARLKELFAEQGIELRFV